VQQRQWRQQENKEGIKLAHLIFEYIIVASVAAGADQGEKRD
jgi:hypothetical protein